MGLVEKFGAEQSTERHGGPLTWPGTDAGFPIQGRIPSSMLKQAEYEELDHKFTYHARWFEMWTAADASEYVYVQERVVNGWFKVLDREKVYDPIRRGYRIWLEWVQVYGVAPADMVDGVHSLLARPRGESFDMLRGG
jgi:hypothetical protein